MTKKIKIIYSRDKCRGLGMCATIAPHAFRMEGKKAVLVGGSSKERGEYALTASLSAEAAEKAVNSGLACPLNAIRVIDVKNRKDLIPTRLVSYGAKRIAAQSIGRKDFEMDRKGYFLIRIDRNKNLIEVGLCRSKNHLDVVITGKSPTDIYYAIARKKLISRLEHAAYLGKELQKAFTALELGVEYVQDSPLNFSKKVKT